MTAAHSCLHVEKHAFGSANICLKTAKNAVLFDTCDAYCLPFWVEHVLNRMKVVLQRLNIITTCLPKLNTRPFILPLGFGQSHSQKKNKAAHCLFCAKLLFLCTYFCLSSIACVVEVYETLTIIKHIWSAKMWIALHKWQDIATVSTFEKPFVLFHCKTYNKTDVRALWRVFILFWWEWGEKKCIHCLRFLD